MTRKPSRASRPALHAPKGADLLFEIGTEELPAAYLPGLIEQLAHQAKTLFAANHLTFKKIENYGTPRRLVLIARGLSALQQKPGEELRGPSKQAAFDAANKPTQALLGFLKSQGSVLSQVKIVASPKGEYVYLVKPPTTIPTTQVLPLILPQLIASLRTPKTMRWDSSGVRFARPIRWLLALYGARPVRLSFGLIASGTQTVIGRPQQLHRVRVTSLDGYLRTLKGAQIILDHEVRRQMIKQIVAKAAIRGSVAPEMIAHGLLDEVTFLTEQPVDMVGEFDRKYLALPREVLLASMAKHQRVFAIESAGSLLPQCIAILEGQPKKRSGVRKVVERILNARLADSLLFWEEDRKRSIGQMSQQLSGVTFHERLGSMAEKSKRLQVLAEALGLAWQLSQDECESLKQAARLAKADLVSTMVKEFPTLQGIMGSYYAQEAGETADVALAIEEHYLPLGGKMPATLIGGALAVVDKYDTLASYFSVGITPTGDQDPFGLRRAAQGIVEVAWKVHRPLPLEALFKARAALPQWGIRVGDKTPASAALSLQIQQYILERLYTFAWPKPQPSVDCIEAVLSLYQQRPCEDLTDAMDRIQSLQRLSGNPNLLKAAKVIERTRNILKGAKPHQAEVDPDRLEAPQEKHLWEVYQSSHPQILALTQGRLYGEATAAFGEAFFEPLHAFFDRVMVNVPQEDLQQNRLALMRAIHTLYTERIADLSKLSILQQT